MRTGTRLLAALAVTQTIGYGVLYYAFAVFFRPMADDLDASTTVVSGAATLSVLVSAAGAVPVGRWLDRRGGRGLMVAGSVAGSLAVLAWSQVRTVAQLYAVFAVIGVASAMVLYEAAFAVVVAVFDARRRPAALLAITIVAGFASTIFVPLAGILNAEVGWRAAIVVLAAILACVTVPLHALAVPPSVTTSAARPGGRSTALRDHVFWLLVVAFVASSAAGGTVAIHLVAYLGVLGHSGPFAAAVTGLLGVLSVTGRLATTGLGRRYSLITITSVVFAVQGVAIAALPLVGRRAAGAIVCVVLFGLGFGVSTIARPALLAARYHVADYATIAGMQALPATLAKALAPFGAAALYTATGSYSPVMAAVAVACLTAAVALALVRP